MAVAAVITTSPTNRRAAGRPSVPASSFFIGHLHSAHSSVKTLVIRRQQSRSWFATSESTRRFHWELRLLLGRLVSVAGDPLDDTIRILGPDVVGCDQLGQDAQAQQLDSHAKQGPGV